MKVRLAYGETGLDIDVDRRGAPRWSSPCTTAPPTRPARRSLRAALRAAGRRAAAARAGAPRADGGDLGLRRHPAAAAAT